MVAHVFREGMIAVDSGEVEQLGQLEGELAPTTPLARLLHQVLPSLARGEPVHLFPEDAALTTAQAARLFDLTPAMLEKRLDAGEIPSFTRGSQRYVTLRDMVAYDSARALLRDRGMDEILRTSVELGAYE
jgi:hypothetical protein